MRKCFQTSDKMTKVQPFLHLQFKFWGFDPSPPFLFSQITNSKIRDAIDYMHNLESIKSNYAGRAK